MCDNTLFDLVNKKTICDCGHVHNTNTIIIESNAISYLANLIAKHKAKKCKLLHTSLKNEIFLDIKNLLKKTLIQTQEVFVKTKNILTVNDANAYFINNDAEADLIIAVGNDYVISLAKYISFIKKSHLIIVPTKIENDIFASRCFFIHDGLSQKLIKTKEPLAIVLHKEINISISRCIASIIKKQSIVQEIQINELVFNKKFCDCVLKSIQIKCDEFMSAIVKTKITNQKHNFIQAKKMTELSLLSSSYNDTDYTTGYVDNVAELICKQMSSVSFFDALVCASISINVYLDTIFNYNLLSNISYPDLLKRVEVLTKIFNIEEKNILNALKKPQSKEKLRNYLYNINFFSKRLKQICADTQKSLYELKETYIEYEKNHGKNFKNIKNYIFDTLNYGIEISYKTNVFDVFRDIGFLDN